MALFKKSKTTTTEIPAKTSGIVVVDTNKGAITVTNPKISKGRRVGGTGSISKIEGDITPEQAQKITGGTPITPTQAESVATRVTEQQRAYVTKQNQSAQAQTFYYRTLPGGAFTGIQYYETTPEGKLIRRLSPIEVKQYGLTPVPTGVLEASEKPRSIISKAKETAVYRAGAKVVGKIESAGRFGYPDPFENAPVYAGTVPVIPAIPLRIFDLTAVRFVGLTQRIEAGAIRTELVYEATRSSFLYETTELGAVKSLSTLKNIDELTLVKTASGGGIIAKSRGPLITYPKQTFRSVEANIVKQEGSTFISGGVGKTRIKTPNALIRRNEQAFFESASIGVTRGEYTQILGASRSRLGRTFSAGIIKETETPAFTYFEAQPSGLTPLTFAKQQALKSTIASIPPIRSSNIPLITSATLSTQKITAREIPATSISIATQPQKVITRQALTLSFAQPQRTSQRTSPAYLTKQEQKVSQAVLNAQIQQPKSAQGLKSFLKTQQLYRQGIRLMTLQKQQRISPTFPKTIPIIPLFRLPKSKGTKPLSEISLANLFVKEKGIFKFKGLFPSIPKAVQRGVDITGKTINRSFKITGGQTGVPFGYRRSRKKGQENVFVELPKTSLSQFGEQFTIQGAKKRRKR